MNTEIKKKKSWVVREYRAGDEVAAVALYNRIFGKDLTLAQYRWKLIDAPGAAEMATTWFADADGQIAGQYAATPMRFRVDGQTLPIAHVCDVMTHPEFRRQGILSTVGETAHRNWQESGLAFVSGIPHKGWGSRSAYLNWHQIYRMPWQWLPLNIDDMLRGKSLLPAAAAKIISAPLRAVVQLRRRRLKKVAGDISIQPVGSADDRFDRIWHHHKKFYKALVVRDAAWIQYRYLQAPDMGYGVLLAERDRQPVGYLAFRIRNLPIGTVGYIADLFCEPDDWPAQAGLIAAVLDYFEQNGARAALTVVSEKSRIYEAFRRSGFWRRYGHFDVSIVPLSKALPMNILDQARHWFSMGGDFDII